MICRLFFIKKDLYQNYTLIQLVKPEKIPETAAYASFNQAIASSL